MSKRRTQSRVQGLGRHVSDQWPQVDPGDRLRPCHRGCAQCSALCGAPHVFYTVTEPGSFRPG